MYYEAVNGVAEALKSEEKKASKFNEEALKSDSNALDDDGDCVEGAIWGALKIDGRH